MRIQTTQEAEAERVNKKRSWELYYSDSLVQATKEALKLGWKENKVQVRLAKENGKPVYYVEPYEEGCGCNGIIKYSSYYESE